MKQPIIYERLEGVAILVAALFYYYHLHLNFIWFIALLFSFDVSMLGYLINNKIGAHLYNLAHSMIAPPTLLAVGTVMGSRLIIGLGLIWFCHIGLDRALGYGLKFASSFSDTHLGHIGNKN